jgi:hypothetical protein
MSVGLWCLATVVVLFWLAGLGVLLLSPELEQDPNGEWYPPVPRPRTIRDWVTITLAYAIGIPLGVLLLGPPILVVLACVWVRGQVKRLTRRST